VSSFAKRLHIDLMDGIFAPTTSVRPDQIWWPGNVRVDLHVMYQDPFMFTDVFIALAPQMVIVHAEATGDFVMFANRMHTHGVEVGVALLPQTPVTAIVPALDLIDHVLIFSGNLGHQGGSYADPSLTTKINELRRAKPQLEIGWDGGINDQNAGALAKAGVDVLNVGGFIQGADRSDIAYQALVNATRIQV
jgi:ribulose-phosphate 3-epimerase